MPRRLASHKVRPYSAPPLSLAAAMGPRHFSRVDSAPKTATPATPAKRRRFPLGTTIGFVAIVGVLAAIVIPVFYEGYSCHCGSPRSEDGSNLRSIGHAMLAYAIDRPDGLLPYAGATDIYDVAAKLARDGLNRSEIRRSRTDGIFPPTTDIPVTIVDTAPTGNGLAPINLKFQSVPLAFAVAIFPPGGGLRISDAPTVLAATPLAWTRGLQPDGIWEKNFAPYGDWGGFVVFADGSLKSFIGGIKGGLVKFGTNEPTSNILEALPPGSHISEFVPPKK